MELNKTYIFTTLIISITLIIIIVINNIVGISAVNKGLQQCVVNNKVIWQKECKKSK